MARRLLCLALLLATAGAVAMPPLPAGAPQAAGSAAATTPSTSGPTPPGRAAPRHRGTRAKALQVRPPRAAEPQPALVPTRGIRMDPQVRPQAAHLALTLDPAQPAYHGTVLIDLALAEPRREVVLHAKGLRIGAAWAEVGARRLAATVRQLDKERIALQFTPPLPAAKAQLGLEFAGSMQALSPSGLFRRPHGERWMAVTQFEPTAARQAFPAFDEPGWKLPWTLELTVPDSLTALSNTSEVAHSPAQPGWKTVRFATTPPLPSYLLAWAVGDLQVRDAGRGGDLTLRIVTPTGRAQEAEYAASQAAPVLQRLEAWFDMPTPFAKLDNLAVPIGHFGAMENPGLVTYSDRLLLAPAGQETPYFKRALIGVMAHEFAHQWFGNLVTLAWWSDLWLNESFASWLGDRITAGLLPHDGADALLPQARANAMRVDRLPGARAVQQPVTQDEDFGNLFNPITYDKGQTVLAMAEGWLGEAPFRDAVRRYIHRHAWGNATSADFFKALGEADPALPTALAGFIQQPGIPLVQAELQCVEGQAPQLLLQARQLLPRGTTPPPGEPPRWQVPVRVRTPAGESRLLLDSGAVNGLPNGPATLALPDARCPAWVQANAGGVGYYRVAYAADGAHRLAQRPQLPVAEAMALLDDARGLHEAGAMDTASAAALVQALAGHARRDVAQAAADLLLALRPRGQPPSATNPAPLHAYQQQWQVAFGQRARTLGWQPRPGDTDDDLLLRYRLLPAVAQHGADAPLQAEANRLAQAWRADKAALAPLQRRAVLATAARQADSALFDDLLATATTTTNPRERRDLWVALGQVQDPALAERARQHLLANDAPLDEALFPLLREQADDDGGRAAALAFVARHHGVLTRRLSPEAAADLPELFAEACSPHEAQEIDAAFSPHANGLQGGQKALERTLQAVALCAATDAARAAPSTSTP